MVEPLRRYVSKARGEQAADTRRRILDAARRLFQSEGFDRTKIEAIAAAAGVSVPTVYAGFKSKRGVLLALFDDARFGGEYQALLVEARSVEDARARLEFSARIARRIYESERETLQLLRGAATVSPEIAAVLEEQEADRRRPQRALVDDLRDQGQLATGLSVERAADIMWTLTGREVFRSLVIDCGWSGDEYERWLCRSLVGQLCSDA